MILGLLISVPAIALLALATPRQASQMFTASFDRRRRTRVRIAGWLLLAGSLCLMLTAQDLGRQVLLWICWLGPVAVFLSLILGLGVKWRH